MANETPTLTRPRPPRREGRGIAGRIWRVAEVLDYGIVGINEGIISTEIARSTAQRKAASAPTGGPLGLEIRHRGIPRGQIPLHGRIDR